jgi:S1-C subfamily serine protease
MLRALPVLALAALTSAWSPPSARAEDDLAPRLRAALVRLHVTSQTWETSAPWKLNTERTRAYRGVVVGTDGVILTEAVNVADQRMIEVSLANSARRYPAKLRHVDRRIGFALVEPADPILKKLLKPLPLGRPVKLDDEFDIHQLGGDNIPERYTARVIRATGGSTGLQLLLKTTCSDNGDGQVALKDGRIVGLLTSTYGSRQQGTIVAIETIRRYLGDFDDGRYNGLPGPGFWTQDLLRDDLRTYYGVSEDQHGIVVTRTIPGHTGHGVLEPGDVILAMDGYALDDEGKFVHERHGRLDASYVYSGRRYAGDTIRALVLRDGEKKGLELDLMGEKPGEKRIPEGWATGRPQFMVVGGLVLLELTSSSSISRSPGGVILRRYRDRASWDPPTERRRIIYVDRLLQDKSNKGYEEIFDLPIKTINGVEINDFQCVTRALEAPENGFHVFRFEGLTTDFVVPADELDEINERIAKQYKITTLAFLRDPEEEE